MEICLLINKMIVKQTFQIIFKHFFQRQKHGLVIEKIKQNSKQKNIENKNAEKNEKKPEEESSQEVIKVCRGGGDQAPSQLS